MVAENIWPLILLGIAISIDGFAVGISYGIRGIKIGLLPLALIGSISAVVICLSSSLGAFFADFPGIGPGRNIGGMVLAATGCWLIYSTYRNKDNSSSSSKKLLFSLRIKQLGIIINILREPAAADFDRSGTLNHFEAVFLGLALALDALGAGFGAGMIGFSGPSAPLLIGLLSILLVFTGSFFGKRLGNVLPQHFKVVPGLIILFLGILNLL